MSAHGGKDKINAYGLRALGPVGKLKLAPRVYFKRLIEELTSPAKRSHG